MYQEYAALAIFVLSYFLFVVFPHHRAYSACGGGLLLLLMGVLTPLEVFAEAIQWNVIGLFFGTLILAELFMDSRVPAVFSEWLVKKTHTVRVAMLMICALSAGLSIFIENVAVVLLIAPIALSLTDRLKISPVKLLILIAVCSNLEGTATLIGDPPSMILAGYMKMGFNDFFIYEGRLGIFFAVQAGGLAALGVCAYVLREHRQKVTLDIMEKVRSWVPLVLMTLLVLILSVCSVFDPDFMWLAGTVTLVLASIGLLWFLHIARWGTATEMSKRVDWGTTFFLIGVFAIVGGLTSSGWIERIAAWMSGHVVGGSFGAYLMITLVAVLVSAFVDNVPFLLAMIPVAQKVAEDMGVAGPLLLFGLLIGSCLGGNITPIGASANIVTVGLLKKRGEVVSFREFMKIGIPFTIAAVVAASIFTWIVWAGQ